LNVISVCLLLTFRIRVSGIGEGEAIQNDSSFLSGNNVGIEKKSLFPVGCFALFFLFLGWDEDDDGKLCGSLAIDCEYSIILIGVCRTNMYVS